VAVLGDGEVLDFGYGPAGGDEHRIAGRDLPGLGGSAADYGPAIHFPAVTRTADRVVIKAAAKDVPGWYPAFVSAGVDDPHRDWSRRLAAVADEPQDQHDSALLSFPAGDWNCHLVAEGSWQAGQPLV
jgi:hypothetical protein